MCLTRHAERSAPAAQLLRMLAPLNIGPAGAPTGQFKHPSPSPVPQTSATRGPMAHQRAPTQPLSTSCRAIPSQQSPSPPNPACLPHAHLGLTAQLLLRLCDGAAPAPATLAVAGPLVVIPLLLPLLLLVQQVALLVLLGAAGGGVALHGRSAGPTRRAPAALAGTPS